MSDVAIVGNRVPRHYFRTSGVGESDITVHAGSYHLALREAGVEMCNIVTYSSILPGTAEEIPHTRTNMHEIQQGITHGEVMEAIVAEASGVQGERITAGIIFGWLYREDGTRHGGLVCEYNGDMTEAEAESELQKMLNELYTNGYDHFALRDIQVHTRSLVPVKKYGTALVMICFLSYDVRILERY